MGPKPEEYHAQVSRPTVALKNICRDYPAGWGILKELLQNADDAGASNIKFVLDENSYTERPLLHEGLAEFQGPALLAYNNSTFSDDDFISLSRIGDSRKAYDGSSTGKFGRGFNSVYNWTDCPSIVSRKSLLILDPHHRWSHEFGAPGGPSWNFVKDIEDIEMRNQMTIFSSLIQDYHQPLQGTVIRIPLRTTAQAQTSEICQRQTTIPEMREVLKEFVSDFGHTGLLFIKNIEQISIVIGNEAPYSIEISNHDIVKRRKTEINQEIRKALTDGARTFHLSFNIDIKCGKLGAMQESSFSVHHMVGEYPENNDLRNWCKSEALIPWVAVASQHKLDSQDCTLGSLFSVLPLPISSNQPVHIHGLFSMSPDRARLYRNDNSGFQDMCPTRWNEWLFGSLIPNAWVKLLSHLAREHPNMSQFHKWPLNPRNHNDISSGICQEVLQTVSDENLSVWYTQIGYSRLQDALLATGQESIELQLALEQAGVPVIYVTDRLRSHVLSACKTEILEPKSICQRLQNTSLKCLSDDIKRTLLAYVVSDLHFNGFEVIELFPFENGAYRSIDRASAFVHRDDEDRDLFRLKPQLNIDNSKISDETLKNLRQRCMSSLHDSLRFRYIQDLNTYCMTAIFEHCDTNLDVVYLDKDSAAFIPKIWDWILLRDYNISDNSIASLWLIPLSNGGYRRIRPKDLLCDTIYAPPGEVGEVLRNFAIAETKRPLIRAKALSPNALQLLLRAAGSDINLGIKDADKPEDFVKWLASIPAVVNRAVDSDKLQLLQLIAAQLHRSDDLPAISSALRSLEIFPKTVWKFGKDEMKSYLNWTAIQDGEKAVGLPENCHVPETPNIVFVDAWREPVTQLLQELKLAECPSILDVVQNYIVPRWDQRILMNGMPQYTRETIERLLRRFHSLDANCQQQIALLQVVPVANVQGRALATFARANRLIDPSMQGIRDLFFANEGSCPEEWILAKYRGVLFDCGMKVGLDEELLEDRVRRFSNGCYSVEEVSIRATNLLKLVTNLPNVSPGVLNNIVRQSQWLPATDELGKLHLASAENCRGARDRLLVSYVLPIVDKEISGEWQGRLGWDTPISHSVLLQQLDHGITCRDIAVVNAVLEYISEDEATVDCQALLDRQCVWTSNGHFEYPRKVFRAGCERLEPYFANVDNIFWHSHQEFLARLGLKDMPTFEDLLDLQSQIEAPLDGPDTAVIIETIRLASKLPNVTLSSLKVPSSTGELCGISEIVFDDLNQRTTTTNYNSTHPGVPIEFIRLLGIEPLSERVMKGELGLADVDDEDEFDQREEVATGIADTLDRYPVEATFKEYIANADDANASEVNWLLDGRTFTGESLLTAELLAFQGPALLVHNNETFEEKDFDGLKHVGRGSKRDRSSAIGKFGRGSQTMYHWTDVPLILSGSYLVILDPLQRVLPMNYAKGHRKPGVKIPLSKLRTLHSGQLAPFEGLWNYSQDLDFYKGTIFRFPLRPLGYQSRLRESTVPLDYFAACSHAEGFFAEARISLLFLRNVHDVDFKVHGDLHPRWSIKRSRGDAGSFSDWMLCSLAKTVGSELTTCKDRWWVAIQDPTDVPTELQHRHKRTMKDAECGMAALVSSNSSNKSMITDASPDPRVFSALPLPFKSALPVHIHSTFLISGDRQSIPIESSMQDAGSEWNRWLLGSAIPALYLGFLEDLGRKIGQAVFSFWPQEVPPQGTIARLIDDSFWKLLRNSLYRLFPLIQDAYVLKKRRIPRLVEISKATFDFLSGPQSEVLAGLLESLIPTLVRVPGAITRRIRSLKPNVTFVTGHMLRGLLRSREASEYLQREILKDKNVVEHLFTVILPAEDGFQDLNGCRILPLVNGNIGTLKFEKAFPNRCDYYVATKNEEQLFGFAPGRLVSSHISKSHMDAVLKHGKWNVERLSLSNVGNILSEKVFPKIISSEVDAWIRDFWKFWHEFKIRNPCDIDPEAKSIHDYPIFEATCSGIRQYMKLNDLNSLPYVLEPSVLEHQVICDRVAGLYRINSRFFPSSLSRTQDSFKDIASFNKFINALSILAKEHHVDVSGYVKSTLDSTHLQTLRKLVVQHTPIHYKECSKTVKQAIECLPLWPAITPPGSLIAAKNAIVAIDQRLFAPWVSINSRVITSGCSSQYEAVLQTLGAKSIENIDILKQYVLPNLPRKIIESKVEYRSFIATISQMCTAAPSHSPKKYNQQKRDLLYSLKGKAIAADRTGVLHTPSDLFDSSDSIFLSAFRHEVSTKFLWQDVQMYYDFWRQVGLRHRSGGVLNVADYLCCLQRLRQRLEMKGATPVDEHLDSDTSNILSPLTSINSPLNTLEAPTWEWEKISSQTVFPARLDLDGQPEYRQETMIALAVANPLLSLNDLVSFKHTPVCWSQIPFPKYEPSSSTFLKGIKKGNPSFEIVWRHLEYLKSCVEDLKQEDVVSFLNDVYSTYDYFQIQLNEVKVDFALNGAPVWLNLDTTDPEQVPIADLKSSWLPIEHLILSSSCDSPPLMSVREGLMPYERLLKFLGCQTIVYPTVDLPTNCHTTSMYELLDRMRKDEKMLDVTFCTDDGDVRAHKLVMATASGYCQTMFNGKWNVGDKVDVEDMKHRTVSLLVDFAYQGHFDLTSLQIQGDEDVDRVADVLDDLLDLLAGADRWDMPRLRRRVEEHIIQAGKHFVRVDNVRDIQLCASGANAPYLKTLCTQFYERNQKAVDLAYQSRNDFVAD